MLNDKAYKILKWIALIVLPAAATLYMALADIWNLPHGQEISTTLMAINAFMGVILGVSTANYNKREEGE